MDFDNNDFLKLLKQIKDSPVTEPVEIEKQKPEKSNPIVPTFKNSNIYQTFNKKLLLLYKFIHRCTITGQLRCTFCDKVFGGRQDASHVKRHQLNVHNAVLVELFSNSDELEQHNFVSKIEDFRKDYARKVEGFQAERNDAVINMHSSGIGDIQLQNFDDSKLLLIKDKNFLVGDGTTDVERKIIKTSDSSLKIIDVDESFCEGENAESVEGSSGDRKSIDTF